VPRINDDTQACPSDWVRDNPITTTERMTMNEKERTITKHELSAVLLAIDIKVSAMKDVMDAAFPPMFKPKEGEVILASNDEDFPVHLFVEFAHMNKLNNYVCHHQGGIRAFSYAHPQTPTQKGEG
jgi:hypothetical protein